MNINAVRAVLLFISQACDTHDGTMADMSPFNSPDDEEPNIPSAHTSMLATPGKIPGKNIKTRIA